MSCSPSASEQVETPVDHEKKEKQEFVTLATEQPSITPQAQLSQQKNVEKLADDHDDDDDQEYPALPKMIVIICAMSLSLFCVAMDDMILATAIPQMTDEFHSLGDIGWYGSAYLISSSTLQLLYGKLYSFYPMRWVYLIALALFEAGSLLCATTPNSIGFILGRALAGTGAAGINTASALGLTKIAPLQTRPMLMGILGSVFVVASIAGPLVGGAFATHVTWRWCFYINLPMGALAALGLLLFFPHSKEKKEPLSLFEHVKRLDLESTAVFAAGVVCLLLALQMGGTVYPWHNGRIIALFILSPILILVFCALQTWKQEQATLPPRLIKIRGVWTAVLFAAALGGAFFCVPYYVPTWFQAIDGVSAVDSAIRCLPYYVAGTITVVLSGMLGSIIGYYTPMMIISSVFMSVGAGMLSSLKVKTPKGLYITYQIIFGIGVGIGIQQPFIAVQTVLTGSDVAISTALADLTQTLGGAIALSVAQTVFQNKLIANIDAAHIPGLDGRTIADGGATQIRSLVSNSYLYSALVEYNAALRYVFVIGAAAAAVSGCLAFVSPWVSVKEDESTADATDAKDTQMQNQTD